MKYFTRDLYRRCQSDDESVLDAACREWEQANERYDQHVQAIEARMSPHLREFTALLLHDARVQAIGQRDGRLLVVLHKDIPPRDLVVLDYQLEAEPVLEPFTDAPRDWSGQTDFQFDELDVASDDPLVYSQAIVFGNGWLMRLLFRDVRVTLAEPVYPGHKKATSSAADLSRAG
jgi:hypothetical protein